MGAGRAREEPKWPAGGFPATGPGGKAAIAGNLRRDVAGLGTPPPAHCVAEADLAEEPALDVAVRVRRRLQEMYAALLSGCAADAVIAAAEVAALALAGVHRDAGAGLGARIDELRRAGRRDLAAEVGWLYERALACEPRAGQICPEHDEGARRAAEIARRLAEAAALVTAPQAADCERAAAWQASLPRSSAVLRLDRGPQRLLIEDWIAGSSQRVLVALGA